MIAEPSAAARPMRPLRPSPARGANAQDSALGYGASCPECGGTIRIRDGDRSVRCGYCGSALYVLSPRGVQSYILEPKVTPAKARLAAIHYLTGHTGARVGARNTSAPDMKLVHVPFWRMRGRLMGWISGDRARPSSTETAPDNPEALPTYATVHDERESYSRLLFKRVDWSTPACVLPCLGLQGISLRTDFLDWDVLDDAKRTERTVALPTRSDRNVRADALSYLTRLAVPPGTAVRASRFHLFDSTLSLYHYPVYVLRYGYAGRLYTITIDGVSGAVVHGEVPPMKRLDLKALFFTPAVLAFLAATWLPLVFMAVAGAYVLDTAQAKTYLPPHDWLALRVQRLLGGED
ncbi:MAG TPA: hypothetical protein VMT60_04010 [Candidatus Bathyarchaeia archaeon]|nr:hypothetical protein [Candidatus Bathyarchaeia archaeon]